MQKNIKKLFKHPLIYGGSIVIIGNLIANFFNFLFNIFMNRALSVEDFGILASIIAIITLPGLAIGAIVPLVIHFSGKHFVKGELGIVKGFYSKIIKFLFISGIVFCILFFIFIPQVGDFFHIKNFSLLILTDIIIFVGFVTVLNMALLQAKLAFGFQALIGILASVIKLLLGVILVFFGFTAGGAVFGMLIAAIVTYILSFLPLKFLFKYQAQKAKVSIKDLFSYAIPSALTFLSLTSFITTDIILVKHFFSPTQAGMYAGMSLVGRVIFYLSAPIGSVMFPVIVQKYGKKENFTNTFKLSLFIVFIPSAALTLFYYFFPKFMILFFLKKMDYLAISPLLWIFGVFISLYCFLLIISNLYLSIGKTKVFIPITCGAILQIILIFFYHTEFLQIIIISLLITFLLVVGLLLYYPYATKKQV